MNRQGQAHIIDGISHLEVGPVERPSAFQKLQAIIRILNVCHFDFGFYIY